MNSCIPVSRFVLGTESSICPESEVRISGVVILNEGEVSAHGIESGASRLSAYFDLLRVAQSAITINMEFS